MKRYIDASDDLGLSPMPPDYITKLKKYENKKSKKRAVQFNRKTKTD
jgi:hypothetical protein